MMDMEQIDTFILAGGKSKRMGSDKASLMVGTQSFLDIIARQAIAFAKNLYIVSDNPIHQWDGAIRLADRFPNLGPLGGIYTSLLHSQTEKILVLSCDIPLINGETITKLFSQEDNYEAIVLTHNNKVMPLVGIYHQKSLNVIAKQIKNNVLSVLDCLELLQVNFIHLDESTPISNINTREDYFQLLENTKLEK